MIKSTIRISSDIEALITAIRTLKFGEIFNARPELGGPARDVLLTVSEQVLVNVLIENEGVDIITVHQGAPVLAEKDLKIGKFTCRQKFKLDQN
jgi:hypothetical protein